MKKNLTTEAGPTETAAKAHESDAYIDALNQVFALFKRNYHNQFFKAYSNTTDLNATKRLWLASLARFAPTSIMQAARSVIETSEFLPTLKTMIDHCEDQTNSGLPDVHEAYIEACRAPSPKANFAWRHPIVYHAGKNCDWFFLQNNPEQVAYPIFKREYEALVRKVKSGTSLTSPKMVKLSHSSGKELSKEENQRKMDKLKSLLET